MKSVIAQKETGKLERGMYRGKRLYIEQIFKKIIKKSKGEQAKFHG